MISSSVFTQIASLLILVSLLLSFFEPKFSGLLQSMALQAAIVAVAAKICRLIIEVAVKKPITIRKTLIQSIYYIGLARMVLIFMNPIYYYMTYSQNRSIYLD